MWGKDPPYKCRDGRTCLQSKSLAGASLDSRRHARRDHRVLDKMLVRNGTPEIAMIKRTSELGY